MTDVETPPDDHAQRVARVLASLSGTTEGAVVRDELREALESEGQSLTDLPEVGLWLALTQVALTGPDGEIDVPVVIDLRDDHPLSVAALPSDAAPEPAVAEPVVAAEPTDEPIEAAEPTDEPARESGRTRGRRRQLRRKRLPTIIVPATPEPPIAPAAPSFGPAPSAPTPPTTTPEPAPQAPPEARSSVRSAWIAQPVAPLQPIAPAPVVAPPTAEPEPEPEPAASTAPAGPIEIDGRAAADAATMLALVELGEHLWAALGADLAIELPDPSTPHGAVPAPYWPRALVRSGAVADPVGSTPRTPDALEAALLAVLDGVALVGEADLAPFDAELQVSLATLTRRVPLERLGRLYPATLAAFLVRQTLLRPDPSDFDDHLPVPSLQRTNAVGLAFSEALVRLGKPVFREVEQRDEFDHRVRYLRRMQLHGGITPSAVPGVMTAIVESHWRGAATGRDVSADWLTGERAVTATTGDGAFRLLTRTDHGARMLEALVDIVRRHHLGAAPASDAELEPLPSSTISAAREWLASHGRPSEPWGSADRPQFRIGRRPGDGPCLDLPPSSSRWHLNGELLGYGSPDHAKTVPIPTARRRKWAVTVDTARSVAPTDLSVQSAADDRVVLFFDEHGRYHHHSLPLGGATATVIAPAGSRVEGERSRTLLTDRWIGFERIELGLLGHAVVSVVHRGSTSVTLPVDQRLDVELITDRRGHGRRALAPRIAFRGHVPPIAEVEVRIVDGDERRTVSLDDVRFDDEHGTFGLGALLPHGDRRDVTITVSRRGFEESVHTVTVPGRSIGALVTRVTHPAARALVQRAVAAFDGHADHDHASDGDTPRHEVAWSEEPILAAASHDWSTGAAAHRSWFTGSGWAPPGALRSVDVALQELFAPLLVALDRATSDQPGPVDDGPHIVNPPLSLEAWTDGLGDAHGVAALDAWFRQHRRPLRQWRITHQALGNLAPLWPRLDAADEVGAALGGLLTAGTLAFLDGQHRAAAADRLGDAVASVPALGVPAAVLGVAFARTRRLAPESRFRPIAIAPR